VNADTAAYLSNVLVDAAMIVWAVALAAFAADFALAPARVVAQDAVPVPVGPTAGPSAGPSNGPPDGPPSEPADGAGAASRSDRWFGIGRGTLVLGTLLLAAAVVLRGVAAGRVPWANMYEFAITGSLLVAVAYLVLARRYDLRSLALWVTGVLLLTIGLAVTVLYVPAGPLVPALRSPWLVIHVAAATIAAAFFTLGMVAAALYLVRDVADRRGSGGGRLVSRLPSAVALDRVAYRTVAFGFPVWTFAVIAGAIWAEYAWGRYWGWDPKETWSLITWIVYAAYLHARTTAGWRGRRAAVVSLVAYATLLFNFFGVNIAFVGLHSYGGV
jgi:cytochrome c-type biogenesis protein CcsB